ncbi:MAG: hypothetical protein K2G45_09340 [Lachnospiraceae bacterium]|nr:hypothetical protein [Lachnospiraceae bacterium]
MKFTKRIYLLCVIMSAIFLFTACGKAKKDDIANDLKENAGMEASDGNAVEKEEATENNEETDTISYVVEEGGRTTNVDAQIYADGYGNVPTFSVTECDDKDEYVLKYAQKLFDKGEYENIKPYEILSREELEKELQFYEEKYSGSEVQNRYTGYIEWLLETFDDTKHVEYPDDKIVYTRTETPDSGDGSWAFVYEEAMLRGNVDGRLWNLKYRDCHDESVSEGVVTRREVEIPYMEAYCIDEIYVIEDTLGMDEPNINNPCSRESAEGQAKQFLGRLGLDNMELLHIVHNNVGLTEEECIVDGYTMIFGMSENGAHLLFSYGASGTNMESQAPDIFAVQPYVEVLVNSNGVYGIKIRGKYNEPEIMSEKSEMLSFDQINEVAKEEFAKMISRDFHVYDIGSIEFGYVYITYDGLSYAVVPVWRYYEAKSERNTTVKTPVLTICALDGSIIYNDVGVAASYEGTTPY